MSRVAENFDPQKYKKIVEEDRLSFFEPKVT
jgi:hypothetical protein